MGEKMVRVKEHNRRAPKKAKEERQRPGTLDAKKQKDKLDRALERLRR